MDDLKYGDVLEETRKMGTSIPPAVIMFIGWVETARAGRFRSILLRYGRSGKPTTGFIERTRHVDHWRRVR